MRPPQRKDFFLGSHVSKDGISPEVDKLKKIRDYTSPTTVTEIRSAVGLFSFFRQFVEKFSHFSSRLTFLTRKNATWKGGVLPLDATDAFQHLKRALCCVPTLGNPLPNRRFYLHADASKGTAQVSDMLGWAVTQKDEKGRHLPLSFGSRVLQGHEENLSVNFLERLAIIEGFQDNYIWLHGRPLTILSDNKPAIAKAKSQEKGILDQLQ